MEKREIKAALEALGLEKEELMAIRFFNSSAESHLRAWVDGVFAGGNKQVSWAASDGLRALKRSEELVCKLLSAFGSSPSGCEHGG